MNADTDEVYRIAKKISEIQPEKRRKFISYLEAMETEEKPEGTENE